MNILVTGSSGFIGKNLVQSLGSIHNVWVMDAKENIVAPLNTSVKAISSVISERHIELLKQAKIDIIVHLATFYTYAHKYDDIDKIMDSNITFGLKLLDCAVKAGVKYFINTGTLFQNYKDQSYCPVNLYAASKQAFQDLAKYYFDSNQIFFVTLKLIDTYGSNDTRPKLFNLWMNAIKENKPIEMSIGEQEIEILHISDVVRGFIKLVELLWLEDKRITNGAEYALPSGERMTLRQLAVLFQDIVKCDIPIDWGKRRYRDREIMNIPCVEAVPDWKPNISLTQGIKSLKI